MTSRGEQLYGYAGRLEDALAGLEKAEDVSERNKKVILRFADHCTAEGLSLARTVKYVFTLKTLAQILTMDFEAAKQKDIETLLGKIERHPRGYSEWTKKDFRVCIKKFYKWLLGTGDDFPEEVRWIKTGIRKDRKKIPQEILTEEEVMLLVDTASNHRDKALLITLYESGARIGELAEAKIRQFVPDQHGAALILIGKTGMRRVRLLAADPYLRAWLNMHPRRDDPNAPMWVKNNGKPMTYSTVAGLIRRITKRSGIKKNVHAHLFRHSRATFLANHLTDSQLAAYFGWEPGTKMTATYVHLAGRDIDGAILGVYGIKIDEEEGKNGKSHLPVPVECLRCGERNPEDASFCSKCGMALNFKSALDTDTKDLLNLVEQPNVTVDPSLLSILIKRIDEQVEARARELAEELVKEKDGGDAGKRQPSIDEEKGEGD